MSEALANRMVMWHCHVCRPGQQRLMMVPLCPACEKPMDPPAVTLAQESEIQNLKAQLHHVNANLDQIREAAEKFMRDADEANKRADSWERIAKSYGTHNT